MDTVSFLHSYNCGDLISILPGIKHLYEETGKQAVIYQRLNLAAFYYEGNVHSTLDKSGQGVCMNEELFLLLKPLVEAQEYVREYRIWKGEQVDYNLDATRDRRNVPLPYSDIYHWPSFVFPELSADLNEPWLTYNVLDIPLRVFKGDIEGKIIVNRTERYNNPYINYFFLRDYIDMVLFVGTEKEHDRFCSDIGLDVSRLVVNNFYELTAMIDICGLFIGNQSMCFHIAEGLKTNLLLEVCAQFPNTLPHGSHGYPFLYQNALEFYFKKYLETL